MKHGKKVMVIEDKPNVIKEIRNVLFWDDRAAIRNQLVSELEKNTTVFSCKNVYEADDVWEKEGQNIDVFIMDMCMSPIGLDDELEAETNAGALTGWIWFWKSLRKDKTKKHPAEGKRVIVFSGYIDTLKRYIENESKDAEEKRFIKRNVYMVDKGKIGAYDEIVKAVIASDDELKFGFQPDE